MASATFQVGDLVELKSDSPVMTILSGPVGDGEYYDCTWFAGKKNERARFPAASLKAVEE